MLLRSRYLVASLVAAALLSLHSFPATAAEDSVAPLDNPFMNPDAQSTDCVLPYDLPFYFTIVAMGSHTYQYMFAPKKPAYEVVFEWEKNVKKIDSGKFPDVQPIKDALNALANGINTGKLKKLSFREMVGYRLMQNYPEDLKPIDDLIEYVVEADFRFPLFDLATGVSSERKLKLLDQFLESYKGPNSGGMGNVPMEAYYTSRVDPWVYSDEFIERVILPMQGQVTPIFKRLFTCQGVEIFEGDAGWCCCNDNTHGNDYRKCYEIGDQSYNCRERDGFCSIGTLKTCPGHIH